MKNWFDVWDNRTSKDLELDSLLEMAGYDSHNSKINLKSLQDYFIQLKKEFNILESDTIFELCSGPGVFINQFGNNDIGCLDFSSNMIEYFKKTNSNKNIIEIQNDEAINLDTKIKFDYIFTFTGLNYFPNLKYSEEVIKKMVSKSNKGVFILDILNEKYEEQDKEMRRESIPDYDEKYKGTKHLYYPNTWFYGVQYNNPKLKIKKIKFINGIEIEGYQNSQYRFSIFIRKT